MYHQQRELAIVKWEYILHQKIFWEYGQERILLKMFHLLIIVRRNIQQKVIQMEFILEIGQDKDGKGALK